MDWFEIIFILIIMAGSSFAQMWNKNRGEDRRNAAPDWLDLDEEPQQQ